MGNINQSSNDSAEEQTQHISLNVDKKPVKVELQQLLNWSLSEIRQIYVPFRRRKGSPILTRSQFLRFIQLSRISSFFIYDNLIKRDTINVFQILSILVMTAYTSLSSKIHFLFNIFDLRCSKKLCYVELILMFKSIVRGYCLLTDQSLPEFQILEKYGNMMFSRADLNNDQLLELGEIQGWLESSKEYLAFFDLFEPETPIKEDYFVFNQFCPYTEAEVTLMLARINKICNKQRIQEQDYLMLKPLIKIRKNKSDSLHSTIRKSLSSLRNDKENKNSRISEYSKKNSLKNSLVLPNLSKVSMHKKKFQNIIIIKGRTITKKQVFELREYFGNISNGKKYFLIEDFIDNFNQEKYNHMKSVAASLFNFLDKKQRGKVEFLDLVTKLYPNLSFKHLQTIQFWSDQFDRNFNIDKKVKEQRDEEVKKRILPKNCITRIEELFSFFDIEKKGYVSRQNLKEILGRACTEKEIAYLFESSDEDKDGKLSLKEFVHVLLPPDLQIQGMI